MVNSFYRYFIIFTLKIQQNPLICIEFFVLFVLLAGRQDYPIHSDSPFSSSCMWQFWSLINTGKNANKDTSQNICRIMHIQIHSWKGNQNSKYYRSLPNFFISLEKYSAATASKRSCCMPRREWIVRRMWNQKLYGRVHITGLVRATRFLRGHYIQSHQCKARLTWPVHIFSFWQYK